MEVVDRYAHELPARCRILIEVHDLGGQAIEEIQANVGRSHVELEQCGLDLKTCHAVISRRMALHMNEIDKILRDLVTFIPLWLEGISKRRALILKRAVEEGVATEDDLAPLTGNPD
jgi:hypothetical protein